MTRFQDKVVAITGGNSGIGLAAAMAFAKEGAKVAIFGRNQATLDTAARNIEVLAVQGDVARNEDLKKFYATIESHFGRVDVVFANAGIAEFLPFEKVGEEHYDRTFDINVKGVFFTVKEALPVLNDQASIILATSVASSMGEPNTSVYAASKAAVQSFARTLSTELLPRGIRINTISPGPTDTPVFDRMGLDEDAIIAMKKYISTRIPMGRMGQPEDIAQAVLFLASSQSAFIAGTELTVDGGFSNCAVLAS